jgi:S-adenosylmethionine:diacylglycerol 3-amino-3-carboxypropyl transferase
LLRFARRIAADRNLYGTLAFAEAAESLRIARAALPLGPDDRLAGVASSGDVLLSLAAAGGGRAEVFGFDLNPMQVALAELKLAATELDVEPCLRFLGISPSPPGERAAVFARLAPSLSPAARALLDRPQTITEGILNAGMTHLIIQAMVALLRRVVDAETLAVFLGEHGAKAERRRALDQLLERPVARRLLVPLLQALAPALKWLFFPHSICRVSTRPDEMIADFFETFRPLFEIGAHDNPVLSRSATGRLHPEWREHLYGEVPFQALRTARAAGAIRFSPASITEGLAGLPDASISRIYLSNVPDYLTTFDLDRLGFQIHRVARPGARVFFVSLCDVDRVGVRFGIDLAEIDPAAAARLAALDNVRLYPLISVKVVQRAG